jgi:hypothetical protein
LTFKKAESKDMTRIMNPPSIPSHLSVFGYEENVAGQLVKQKSNQVGFAGNAVDSVGPGDYEIDNSKNVTTKNTVGVVTWKKPQQKPKTAAVVEATKKTELPGPGQYEVAQGLVVNSRKPQMVFASKV